MNGLEYENPVAALGEFDRSDWIGVAQRLALMVGFGAICAALGIRVAGQAIIAPFTCYSGPLLSTECATAVQATNHYIRATLYPGVALMLAGAAMEVFADG